MARLVEMGGLIASLAHPTALWVRIQTSLKNLKMSEVSKGEANTVLPDKKLR